MGWETPWYTVVGDAFQRACGTTEYFALEGLAGLLDTLGDLDALENLMRSATQPGELAEVDLDRARELLGDDAARSLDDAEISTLAVLMLRGPQTAAELKQRTERLHAFGPGEVEETLARLAERELVTA